MTRWRHPLTLIWLLALSVVLTLLVSWLLFPWEIAEQNLTAAVKISDKAILSNFNQLMVYLLTPWVNPLVMDDFPVSVSGAKHFVDVKHLFLLAEGLALLLAPFGVKGVKDWLQDKVNPFSRRQLLVMASLPLLIAILGTVIGFDQFFVLFHSVLFPGDSSWLFDPAIDPVILILPETYFLHCFLVFLVIYEGIFGGLWLYLTSRKDKL